MCFSRLPFNRPWFHRFGARGRLLAVLALLGVSTPSAGAADIVHTRSIVSPVFLDLPLNSPAQLLSASMQAQEQLAGDLAQLIRNARVDAEGVVAIRPSQELPLSFHQLPEHERLVLSERFKSERSAQWQYEMALARLLHTAIEQAQAAQPNVRIAVFGLPVEFHPDTNDRYASVIRASSAFVSTRPLRPDETAPMHDLPGQRYIDVCLEIAAGRPIYYQGQETWMMAVGTIPTPEEEAAAEKAKGSGAKKKKKKASSTTAKSKLASRAAKNKAAPGTPPGAMPGVIISAAGSNAAPAIAVPKGPRPKTFVSMQTSPAVQALYPQHHAVASFTVPADAWDADGDGIYDDDTHFQFRLKQMIPSDYEGPVALNWEGPMLEALSDPDSKEHAASLAQFILVIQKAKKFRPNAKYGFVGLPVGRYFDRDETWYAQAEATQPIFDESQCLFPLAYDGAKDGATNDPDMDLEVTTDCVSLALRHAAGKPVYPYIHHRWATSDPQWGFRLIPKEEFMANIGAVFAADFEGDKPDGIVWWGADNKSHQLSQENVGSSNPQYIVVKFFRDLFKEEIPEGMSAQDHFDAIYEQYLTWTAQAVTDSM